MIVLFSLSWIRNYVLLTICAYNTYRDSQRPLGSVRFEGGLRMPVKKKNPEVLQKCETSTVA